MNERIFNHYKDRFIKESGEKKATRFIVIQYLCQFPGINSVEMAAALIKNGMTVAFDDNSISTAENQAFKRKVNKLLKIADASLQA